MRIIVKIDKKSNEQEYFTGLETFYEYYPEYEARKDSINSALSRKKQPFDDGNIIISREIVKERKRKK
jgi:hypothetical protein